MWIWVLSATILGSNPEHTTIAKFATKSECEVALKSKKDAENAKGKEVVGSCYYSKIEVIKK